MTVAPLPAQTTTVTLPSPGAVLRAYWPYGLVFLALMALDLSPSIIGQLLAPAIGDPNDAGLYGRFVCALVVTALLWADVWLVGRLPGPFVVKLLVVWAQLLALFLAFFYSFDLSYEFIGSRIGFLITQGAFTTIYVSLISIAIACAIALLVALAKLSRNPIAQGCATFYISFFRGLPLLMQLYLLYIGLPQIGFVLDPVPAGIAALAICYGAYMAEIFRAGIEAVPQGQREAASALGLKQSQTLRLIVLPQAIRIVVPPIGNQFIAMLKDSSLISVVGVWELTFLAKTQGRAEFKHLEMLITAALVYWLLSIVFELIQSRIEAHYAKGERR